MRRKRADLSINYIFLIFIATIAIFVIIGMITKWSFNANKFVKSLTGTEDDIDILDIQIINVTDCGAMGDNLRNEIVKHAKICYTKATEGKVKGSLCYGLVNPGFCWVDPLAVETELNNAGITASIPDQASLNQRKIIIGYNYKKKEIEIH